MSTKSVNRKSLLVAGIACIVLAVSNIYTHDTDAGIFWAFIGVCVFLWASRMKDGDTGGAAGGSVKTHPDRKSLKKPGMPGKAKPPKPERK